jgi:hypothetical protein
MNRRLAHPLIGLTVALAAAAGSVPSAFAAAPGAVVVGEVLALENTPHLFVRDEAGMLHMASDAQALAGHPVAWGTRKDIPVGELRRYTLGTPWLSMALVRIGTAIYLPQAQPDGGTPVLRLVGSVNDLALIGINAENYGDTVLDQAAWEARYGLRTSDLRFDDLSLDGQLRVGPPAPEVVIASSESTTQDGAAQEAQMEAPGRPEEEDTPVGVMPAEESTTAEDLARY